MMAGRCGSCGSTTGCDGRAFENPLGQPTLDAVVIPIYTAELDRLREQVVILQSLVAQDQAVRRRVAQEKSAVWARYHEKHAQWFAKNKRLADNNQRLRRELKEARALMDAAIENL